MKLRTNGHSWGRLVIINKQIVDNYKKHSKANIFLSSNLMKFKKNLLCLN